MAMTKATINKDRKRVLLVDDHPVFREGLNSVLARESDVVVVGQAGNARQALTAIEQSKPDAVLLDLNLPDKSGLELVKDLRAIHPDLILLIISMSDEALYAERLLRAGANGYVMKEEGPEKILDALRQVLRQQIYVSERMSARILKSLSTRGKVKSSPIACLSDREFEIFQLIGKGLEGRVIARQLNISPKTVDAHRGHIKDKLKVASGIELICYAVRWMETQQTEDSARPSRKLALA
jgi:DNA-binding NarL/FixJ family response regulator